MTWIKAKWLQCQVIQVLVVVVVSCRSFFHTVAQLVHSCNDSLLIDIDQYCGCAHSTFRTFLMVNKHTNCNVLLIKGVRNKCDISHSAATIRTCMYAMHLPFLYPLSWHVHSMMTILSQSCLIQNGYAWLLVGAIWLDASWGGMGGIICNGYFIWGISQFTVSCAS